MLVCSVWCVCVVCGVWCCEFVMVWCVMCGFVVCVGGCGVWWLWCVVCVIITISYLSSNS
jgi:hypothetical protein